MRFEYQHLVNLFENALLTELRGHGSSGEFLRSWVPDNDPVKSLINMADAADLESVDNFEIDIQTSLLSPAAFKELSEALKGAYVVKFDASKAQRIILSFSRADSHPAARSTAATTTTKKTIAWNGDGWSIDLAVTDGVIADAKLKWNDPSADKGLIESLAGALKGMGLREARDHGVQYACAARQNGAPAVSGVVIPANFSRTSRSAMIALRKAIDAAEQPNPADWNFEDHGLSDAWRKVPKDVRSGQLQSMINDYLKKNGIADDVMVTEIDQYDRVFLQFGDTFPAAQKPSVLMQLERYVRNETGERIELFVSELKDNNRIRRL